MKVWGVSVSYFTGKLETYLRYKHIPYEMEPPYADAVRVRRMAGAVQVPLIEREDGRFMSDTTPIIQALETEFPARPVMPQNPVVRFIALLIEEAPGALSSERAGLVELLETRRQPRTVGPSHLHAPGRHRVHRRQRAVGCCRMQMKIDDDRMWGLWRKVRVSVS